VILKAIPSLQAIAVIQHGLAIMVGLLAAWLCRTEFRCSWPFVITAFLLTALLPRSIVYAQSIMTETLYTFLLVTCVSLYFLAKRRNDLPTWMLLGVVLAASLLVRPVARGLVISLMAFMFVGEQSRGTRRRAIAGLLTAFVILGMAGTLNYRYRGFFGTERFTGIPLFGQVGKYLEVEQIENVSERKLLSRFFLESYREKWEDPNWVRFSSDGPVAALTQSISSSQQVDAVLLRLSFKAVAGHPLRLLSDQGQACIDFLLHRSERPRFLLPKDYAAAGSGQFYNEVFSTYPQSVQLITFRLATADSYLKAIRAKRIYPFEKASLSPWFIWHWTYLVGWLGIVGVMSALLLLSDPSQRGQTGFLLMVIFLHIALSNLGGDRDGRHALPIEPLLILLSVAGANTAINLLIKSWQLKMKSPPQFLRQS
jgi:4-amino-4-deoxy-L-arabinose transferase-like glycosyltransferase